MKIQKRHDKKDMTKRHLKLHRSLDELIACFYIQTGLLSQNITLAEFMVWSYKMSQNPTCATVEKEDGSG